MSKGAEQKSQAREKAAALHATQLRAERRRRLLLAVGAVAVVLVVIGGLVAVRLAGGGKKETSAGPSGAADTNLISTLASIPAETFAAVGSDGVQAAPSAITAPHLLSPDGKPKVLYVGAEFCPFCAAERWPVTVALSRFGTFSNLGTTHSAAADVYPNTATLSFHGASFTSKYLAFTGVETTTNEEVNGRYAPLDKLTAEDQKTFDTFNQPPYVKSAGSIPFIDLGGQFANSGATFSPEVLAGKTQSEIATALKDPANPIAQAIDGSANVYTAALCQLTKNQPAAVCSTDAVKTAAGKLGKS
ncbi:DUF929 family protein [Kribbella sp. NPDC023855]|uniref:DUF929 family protein n=1 Tax=Kribbella sp. NPDC023855 TaxID=3154698 RepID=UPI0033DD7CE9